MTIMTENIVGLTILSQTLLSPDSGVALFSMSEGNGEGSVYIPKLRMIFLEP